MAGRGRGTSSRRAEGGRKGGREDEDGTAGPGAWKQFALFLLWFSDAPTRQVPSVPPAVYFQLR